MSERALSVLVHGESKSGKSTLANTAPAPRLIMDVEAAARFLPGKKIYWDPMDPKTPKPPKYDGTWETCVVVTDTYEIALKTYEWLKSGKHDFRSVILDSVSELQAKIQESVNERKALKIQHWGELGTKLAFYCRDLRDLTARPDSPIDAVVVTAMSKETQEGHVRPFLSGQVATQLPYWFDVTSYLYVDLIDVEDEDGNVEEARERFLLVEPMNNIVAGNRVGGRLPDIVERPNISEMIVEVFGPEDGDEEEYVDEEEELDDGYEEEYTEEEPEEA